MDEQNKKAESELAKALILGKHAVLVALQSQRPLEKILINRATATRRHGQILREAKKAGIPVQFVPEYALTKKAGTEKHQDVIGLLSEVHFLSLDELLTRVQTRLPVPVLAMLDGIEDPHNLGAILRSADAMGIAGVIVQNRRRAPFSGTVSKTSAGAIHTVPIAQVVNLQRALRVLKEKGFWVIGTDERASEPIWEIKPDAPLVVVIGSEGKGLHRLVREECDFLAKIPMFGTIESLNASVAAGIVFYEIRKKISRANPGHSDLS